jgi:hypothetical protein
MFRSPVKAGLSAGNSQSFKNWHLSILYLEGLARQDKTKDSVTVDRHYSKIERQLFKICQTKILVIQEKFRYIDDSTCLMFRQILP